MCICEDDIPTPPIDPPDDGDDNDDPNLDLGSTSDISDPVVERNLNKETPYCYYLRRGIGQP